VVVTPVLIVRVLERIGRDLFCVWRQNLLDIWLSVLCVTARIFACAGVCFETVVIAAPHGIVRCVQRLLLCRRTRGWSVISAARRSMWRVLLFFRVTPRLWRVGRHTRQAGLHFMHLCLQSSERFFGNVWRWLGLSWRKNRPRKIGRMIRMLVSWFRLFFESSSILSAKVARSNKSVSQWPDNFQWSWSGTAFMNAL